VGLLQKGQEIRDAGLPGLHDESGGMIKIFKPFVPQPGGF
jgi:hypothetical protein